MKKLSTFIIFLWFHHFCLSLKTANFNSPSFKDILEENEEKRRKKLTFTIEIFCLTAADWCGLQHIANTGGGKVIYSLQQTTTFIVCMA